MLAAAHLRAFEHRTLPVVLECAGHRRAEFDPAAPGLRWGAGAASEAHWTGVPLAAVLTAAGIADGGVEVVLRGADGEGYARSLPLAKALHPDTLLAVEMNGEPIPPAYGGPVRAIVPGWYGMDSSSGWPQSTWCGARSTGRFSSGATAGGCRARTAPAYGSTAWRCSH